MDEIKIPDEHKDKIFAQFLIRWALNENVYPTAKFVDSIPPDLSQNVTLNIITESNNLRKFRNKLPSHGEFGTVPVLTLLDHVAINKVGTKLILNSKWILPKLVDIAMNFEHPSRVYMVHTIFGRLCCHGTELKKYLKKLEGFRFVEVLLEILWGTLLMRSRCNETEKHLIDNIQMNSFYLFTMLSQDKKTLAKIVKIMKKNTEKLIELLPRREIMSKMIKGMNEMCKGINGDRNDNTASMVMFLPRDDLLTESEEEIGRSILNFFLGDHVTEMHDFQPKFNEMWALLNVTGMLRCFDRNEMCAIIVNVTDSKGRIEERRHLVKGERFCDAGDCENVGYHRTCAGCRGVWYCSASCQKKCWKSHKNVCKHIKALNLA